MRRVVLFVVILLSAQGSFGQITKDQLLEMLEKKVDVSLIVSLVEKDCVDFDVDAATVLELAKKVPNPVLQAAINCKGGQQGKEKQQQAMGKPESLECLIYKDLTSHPGLVGFPVVVDSIKNGYVTIVGVDAAAWAQEKTRDLSRTFDYIELHRELSKKAVETVRKLPSVKDAEFLVYKEQGTGTVTEMQKQSMEKACAKKGTAKVTSVPPKVGVFVDGASRGETPLSLELTVGEHAIRLESETLAPFERRISIKEDQVASIEAKLDKLGELLVSSEPANSTILINGELKGQAPQKLYLPAGDYTVQVMAVRRLPHSEKVKLELNQSKEIQANLPEIPRDEYCYTFEIQGKVGANFKLLKQSLSAESFNLVVPLYQAVTSIMGRKLDSTHVVNGERFAYEPRYGAKYVDKPAELLGRELGGLAFGEVVSDVTSTPPGLVRIADLSKKGSTLRIELVYADGRKNSVFLDFDKKVDDLDLVEFADAFCACFSKHASFRASS